MDFYIMSADSVAAVYKNGKLDIEDRSKLPLYLINTENVEIWLEMRAIDTHRANSRLLKKALRLAQRDDISTVLAVNAATITDRYWVKPIGSELSYEDVRFKSDYFATLALNGSYDSFNRASRSKSAHTPELTNIGSFEKCWRLRDGCWYMQKRASHDELFSELFVYSLGKKLGFNMAEYERGKGIIITKDFTDGARVNFESAYSFMGENEEYIDTLIKLRELCPSAEKEYVEMLFLDSVCANPDRHTLNFGVLRDTETGKVLGMAPNFDNNMALISRGYPRNRERKHDLLVELFNELTDYEPSLKCYIPKLSEEMIEATIREVGMRVRSKEITEFVMNGYRRINK